jgi:hypothetical protein
MATVGLRRGGSDAGIGIEKCQALIGFCVDPTPTHGRP